MVVRVISPPLAPSQFEFTADRKRNGLSQENLARLADISNNTFAKIEMGMAKEPTIITV